MNPALPSTCKPVIFFITNAREQLQEVLPAFEEKLGPVLLQSAWFPFHYSRYYEEEMGPKLERCFVGFKNNFPPEKLPELKYLSIALEKKTERDNHRTINIDPGYIDLYKLVLATGKGGGKKVALTGDVFAHTFLCFEKKKWVSFEGTFPDFKETHYHEDLRKIRDSLLNPPS